MSQNESYLIGNGAAPGGPGPAEFIAFGKRENVNMAVCPAVIGWPSEVPQEGLAATEAAAVEIPETLIPQGDPLRKIIIAAQVGITAFEGAAAQ